MRDIGPATDAVHRRWAVGRPRSILTDTAAAQAQACPQLLVVTAKLLHAHQPASPLQMTRPPRRRARHGTHTRPMLQAATTAWVTADVPVDAAALKDRAQEGLQDKAVLKSGLDPAKHGSKRDLAVRAGGPLYSALGGIVWRLSVCLPA